jgi:hypothetical protein
MRDNDIQATQIEVLYTSPTWAQRMTQILVWRQNEHGKYVLPDGEAKTLHIQPHDEWVGNH